MNALVRKEVRLLLPAWMAAMIATVLPALACRWADTPRFSLLFGAGGVMALVVALGSFGRELGFGTFSSLIAQPVSRARLWWTKVSVLAGALVSVYVVWWLSFSLCASRWPALHRVAVDAELTPWSTGLFLFVLFSGGLWTTLVFRQVAAAVWFTLLLPLVLVTMATALLERFAPNARPNPVLAGLTVAYGLGGFVLAWRLFLRLEDTPWTGGTITLRGWSRAQSSAGPNSNTKRGRRPMAALLHKEFHLHQAMLGIAGLLFVLHLGVIAMRQVTSIARLPLVETILGTFWGLWLTMPFLINATAAAEERKLGVHEGQLCQPVGRRRQIALKFVVAMVLGLLLGTVPPCLLENARQLPNMFSYPEQVLQPWGHWLMLGTVSAMVGMVAFYASTLARNTLQALGLGIVMLAVGSAFFSGLGRPESMLGTAYWLGDLGWFIGYPLFTVALLILIAANFQRLQPGRRDWTRNLATLGATALATVLLTAGIYHRAWEWLQDTDPAHRVASLGPGQTVRLRWDGTLSALSADGTLQVFPRIFRMGSRTLTLGHFAENWSRESLGTGWVASASSYFDTVAIRTDGTLWASESPRPYMVRSTDPIAPAPPLIQLGTEAGWKDVVRNPTSGRSVLLLKIDGTLWRWGVTNRFRSEKGSLHSTVPQRLGRDSDWTKMLSTGPRVYVTKRNGQVWVINHQLQLSLRNRAFLDNRTFIDPAILSARCEFMDGVEWRALFGPPNYDLGVKADGTLWAIGPTPWSREASSEQLDAARDWQSVTGNYAFAVALKTDGSLWKLDFRTWNRPPTITRLSRQTDWRAVASSQDSIFALSADGDLWRWDTYAYRPGWIEIAPSRIPSRISSILN